jgi:hypothetical protein
MMRIARTMRRLSATTARARETNALLIEAREHLALARLAAQVLVIQGNRDLPEEQTAERSWHAEDDSATARGAR